MTKEEIAIVVLIHLGLFFPKLRVKVNKDEYVSLEIQLFDSNGFNCNTPLEDCDRNEIESRLINYLTRIEMFFLTNNNNDIGHLK